MYRAYVYWNPNWETDTIPALIGEDTLRLTSQPVKDYRLANQILGEMHKLPGATGGDLERKVDGIGWCLCDHDDEQRS